MPKLKVESYKNTNYPDTKKPRVAVLDTNGTAKVNPLTQQVITRYELKPLLWNFKPTSKRI